ncbi:MAG: heme-copper oxidase subunit III [Verrucomicrobia bacterium]|nr:heme-copper oxidase subunit III [Verrucomicrobiota bacterium]
MEIPYTAEARPDTGVYNAKIGLWLFLASEVMLFGALFSSYILLRVGSPEWPQGLLSVPIGALNTFVLIGSSITVVMSWLALKGNDFGKFKLYMGSTILLALLFISIKSFEYHDKFTHYFVKLKDGTELTGHIEGRPFNWSLAKLKASANAPREIAFHPDAPKQGEPVPDSTHQTLRLPVEQIAKLESFGPWRNTYLAIYFTLSGLHALHVVGGIVVMLYHWGAGHRLWRKSREQFTNRVEVTGLYWHFVELVWIFLFPVMYIL